MEQDVFPAPKIAALLEPGFVEARLHTDHPNAEKGDQNRKRQMAMVGYVAAPYYLVVDPKTGKELARHTLSGSSWEADFAAFLQKAQEQAR
jgi:hypothetical protein